MLGALAERWVWRGPRPRMLALALAALLGASGCAGPGTDMHVEPLYARYTRPAGATETEALFGFYNRRVEDRRIEAEGGTPTPATLLDSTTIGPLFSFDRETEGAWRSRFLVPLGYSRHKAGRTTTRLPPLFAWQREPKLDGSRQWQLISFPGWIFLSNSRTGTQFAWFPFFGDLDDFLIWERIRFVLFPLYTELKSPHTHTYSVLFPFFAVGHGKKSGFRVWPIYGSWTFSERYKRTFALWPFFHWQHNRLGGGGEVPQRMWMVFPFVGHARAGTRSAWSFLWPFFGFTHDPKTDFWALDCPWPLVRLQRSESVERTRFWPFYSNLKAENQDYTQVIWPLVHIRKERYRFAERDSIWVIPFWQAWRRCDLETGQTASWYKLWPVLQHERRGDWSRGSFPTLNPFHRSKITDDRLGLIDRHFGWAWRMWEWENEGALRTERSWAGLMRYHESPAEDRSSVSVLWARRRYTAAGAAVKETSLLFGLLRWRVTEGRGFDMLRPAFPGPGWPSYWRHDGAAPETVQPTD